MKKILLNLGVFSLLTLILTGCYPGGAEYTDDLDLAVTSYDESFDFTAVKTYFLPDSINHIIGEDDDPDKVDRSLDPFIISELARNFDGLGYTRLDSVDENSPPDVIVFVNAIRVTNYNIYSYPWYPGWGYPGYGWGYPWYGGGYGWGYPWYGGTSVTSYETGTVFWDYFDPKNYDAENEVLYTSWRGAINGLLSSNKTNTNTRISRGIDQTFLQSPYLRGE